MKIRSALCAALGAMMISDSAFALSCMRPDLVKTLEDAKSSETIYYVLVGNFVSPKTRSKHKPYGAYTSLEEQFDTKPPIITQAFFEGYSISNDPKTDRTLVQYPVDIETSCMGPWCSGVPSLQEELIAFVEARKGQAPLLRISPCPSTTFPAKEKHVEKIRQCLDETCESTGPDW